MYRFSIFVLQFLLLIIGLTFIFTNPFIVSLDIGNLKYSFSSNLFAVVFISFIFLLYLVFYLFFRSRLLLGKYFLKNKYNKIEKGYLHFVDAMIAVANKDNKTALKSHKKMVSYLKDDPSLSLLLKSEVLKIEKKFPELNNIYEDMIKSKKTETLGYRGLMEQNLRNQDYHHAFLYGEKLFSINPNIEKLYDTLIFIAAKTKNWNQIISLSDKAFSNKIITKNDLNENKSIGFYEIAKIKYDSDIKDSLKNILKAVDMKKNFPPYVKLHLEITAALNDKRNLKKLIKKYWSLNPSSLLRSIIIKILNDNDLTDIKFINEIIKNNAGEEESKKLLIYFSIKNLKWDIARENIIGMIGSSPSRDICYFMSDIELGENNDKQKSDAWIMRAENAKLENCWICRITNQSQEEWSSLSNSGNYNSLVWTSPMMIRQNSN
ncbi:hypothetical protein OA977_01235 [Pelagibacteraceae bacterium]|nr:hypothetical protein [Pelagibacteraceae bacterium]